MHRLGGPVTVEEFPVVVNSGTWPGLSLEIAADGAVMMMDVSESEHSVQTPSPETVHVYSGGGEHNGIEDHWK